MYHLSKFLSLVYFIFLLFPSISFSLEAKSNFGRQFEQNQSDYYYPGNDYYYAPSRVDPYYQDHYYQYPSTGRPADRPYYYMDKGGVNIYWPNEQERQQGGQAVPGK